MHPNEINLLDLQPSQLFVSTVKLIRVESTLSDYPEKLLEPLPVIKLDGKLVLTDGHTRALAAYRAGMKTVTVYLDTDDLDLEAYRTCVAWCIEEGIRCIGDLSGRILSADEYKELWLDRCRRMHRELENRR